PSISVTNDTTATYASALSLHDALPISMLVNDEEAVARLAREARTVAQLQHAHIVMLYGTRRLADQSLALIMQYVPGRTVKETIRSEEHTSELQSREKLVCRLLLEKKNQ